MTKTDILHMIDNVGSTYTFDQVRKAYSENKSLFKEAYYEIKFQKKKPSFLSGMKSDIKSLLTDPLFILDAILLTFIIIKTL